MSASERDKIAARIRGLLSKTVENGCTEDEAIAAAAKAAEMLARYNLSVDEVQMRENAFEMHVEHFTDFVADRIWKVADGIAYLTGTRYWTSRPGVYPIEINFFGFAHEVEIAKYLLAICRRAMLDAAKPLAMRFALLEPERRKRKLLPFLDGMADTLRQRIRALKPKEPTGTGLIVLRGQLIDAAMKDQGVTIKSGNGRPSHDFDDAYRDGANAAERVELNPGLADSGRQQIFLK